MGYTSLNDLKKLTKEYSGNDNPGIFLLSDDENDSYKSFTPTCIFIDDEDDLILQFNPKYLTD